MEQCNVFSNMECIQKWKLNELSELVGRIEDDMAKKTKGIKLGKDYSNIILRIMSSSVVCMREIMCLCACGYPDGAMARARLLCEHAVILEYFEIKRDKPNFKTIIENYHKNYEIQRLATCLFSARNVDCDKKALKEIEDELNKLKSQLQSYKEGNDYWWTDQKSFSEIFKLVTNVNHSINGHNTFFTQMHADYQLACLQIHSSCLGNVWKIGRSKDITKIDTSPTLREHNIPLRFATRALSVIVYNAYLHFTMDYEQYKESFSELYVFYNQKHDSVE